MRRLELEPSRQRSYFGKDGGISDWWRPEEGPYRHHYVRELHVLRERLVVPNDARVVDLGTGHGRFARFFAHQGVRVTAVDVSRDMLTLARDRAAHEGVASRIDFVEDSVEDFLARSDRTFDLVSIMELLDHLPDPQDVLAKCSRALRPRGRIVLTFVSQASLHGRIAAAVLPRLASAHLRVARPYLPREVAAWLRAENLSPQFFGVGLAAVIARETEFPFLSRLLGAVCRFEGLIKPYYRNQLLAPRCTHVVAIATKLTNLT
jgi:2-polyprenyl-6-hydroxyphenyl methylase/3-demethylubiquinone-9 3-methyltransferase